MHPKRKRPDQDPAVKAAYPLPSLEGLSGPPYLGTFGRPARPQATEIEKWDTDATDYNIWYNRKCGEYRTKRIDGRDNATSRCEILRDAGETKAEAGAYICIYFARGKCVRGKDCTFAHRLPAQPDEDRLDLAYDVFGRDRHRTEREDMGGVGTFSRENRTLYVGGVRRVKGVDLHELVVRNFVEWGELEAVRVIWDKSIAFVRYKLRAAAEFAKEAMADQSLGYHEVLNVRWAHEDPNPRVIAENKLALEMRVREAVLAHHGPEVYPDMHALSTGDAYPVTDHQFLSDDNVSSSAADSQYFSSETDSSFAADPHGQATNSHLLHHHDQPPPHSTYHDSTQYMIQLPSSSSSSSAGSYYVDTATAAAEQQEGTQQQYTAEQWRAWYMYYYGYIPEGLQENSSSSNNSSCSSSSAPTTSTPPPSSSSEDVTSSGSASSSSSSSSTTTTKKPKLG